MPRAISSGNEVRTYGAEIDTRNARSIALVERSGFEFTGRGSTDEGEDAIYERSA